MSKGFPISKVARFLFQMRRLRSIDHFRRYPEQVQREQLKSLLRVGANTLFGKDHDMREGMSATEFASKVPVSSYEELTDYIWLVRSGEKDVLWRGYPKWVAKSSGTTDNSSKYIPITHDGLKDMHTLGPRDVMGFYCLNYPENRVLNGYTLTLGGSHKLDPIGNGIHTGDLSSILIEQTPFWARNKRQPDKETALLPDFNTKVEKICREVTRLNVTAFAGVPSWNMVMLNRVLEYTGAKNLLEVWPNLELFIHGGMNFKPYREQYDQLIPSSQMHYLETYNASEGFFAIQDDPTRSDMLLMLDYNIYYEFIPMESLGDSSTIVPLEGVKVGKSYALVISNSCGLWRYMIGDTVEFTSTSPYRIKITGRTKLFINAFGEEIVIENAEEAMHRACELTEAQIFEYSGAPIYMSGSVKGSHEWVVEFTREPSDLELFIETLDTTLRRVNSDYAAKRESDTTLLMPTVSIVPKGTFTRWMLSRGKSGGQNKVPRLSNNRDHVEALKSIAREKMDKISL